VSLRVPSDLPADLEDVVRKTIDCCFAVHVALGPGWLEAVYRRAVAVELEARQISFEVEKSIPIRYRGALLCHHRLDLFVDQRVVLELKAIDRLQALSGGTSNQLLARVPEPSRAPRQFQRPRSEAGNPPDCVVIGSSCASCLRGREAQRIKGVPGEGIRRIVL
jgi:GxxExxY protein